MMGEPVLVMLVEDNIDHAELVIRTMEDHRIANTIKHFSDGQTALDYLMDGLEVLRIIKEDPEVQKIPIIVLTTSEAERDVARAYDNHVNSYLVKPVGFEEFSKLMNDLGFYWLGWNTHPQV